jgi:hypothetical protein
MLSAVNGFRLSNARSHARTLGGFKPDSADHDRESEVLDLRQVFEISRHTSKGFLDHDGQRPRSPPSSRMILMPQRTLGQNTTSAATWAPAPNLLEALDNAPHSAWGWEYLRRNLNFKMAALQAADRWAVVEDQRGFHGIVRGRQRDPAAEAWGLCSFR